MLLIPDDLTQQNFSFTCGLALAVFLSLLFSSYVFDFGIPFCLAIWISFPLGIIVAIGYFANKIGRHSPKLLSIVIALCVGVMVMALTTPGVLNLFICLSPFWIPMLIIFFQVWACSSLINSGVSKRCRVWLIASVILALVSCPIADYLGSHSRQSTEEMTLLAGMLGWLVCAIIATFFTGDPVQVDAELEASEPIRTVERGAVLLWAIGTMTWLPVVLYVFGVAEKGSF